MAKSEELYKIGTKYWTEPGYPDHTDHTGHTGHREEDE
jgi:hypothetical protein